MTFNSSYWKGQLDYYQSNRPPKPESFYNKDFVERMNDAQRNIDNLVAAKDRSWAARNQAQDDYKAFYGSMSEYNDVYNKAESEFGVTQHQDNYEKNKKALAMAEATMESLPSSISATSNRVLTQQQKEARYNVLADRHMANISAKTQQSEVYKDVWRKARESQQAYASAEIAQQWSKLEGFQNTFLDYANEYNNASRKISGAKLDLMSVQNDYRSWQTKQYENAFAEWSVSLSNALARYQAALQAEMADRRAQVDYNAAQLAARKDKLAQSLVNLHHIQQGDISSYSGAYGRGYSGGGGGGGGGSGR